MRAQRFFVSVALAITGCAADATSGEEGELNDGPQLSVPEKPNQESYLEEKIIEGCGTETWVYTPGTLPKKFVSCNGALRIPAGGYLVYNGQYGSFPGTPCRTMNPPYVTTFTNGWFNPNYDSSTCNETNANPYDMCPPGMFVYAFSMKQEQYQGSGDDTGLNAIGLACYPKNPDANSTFSWIYSYQERWGDWMATATPTNFNVSNPMVGLELKAEGSQGSGDDAAASMIRVKFLDTQVVTPSYYGNAAFGSWRGMATCPTGQAVCGLATRVEGSADPSTMDDTALNGAAIACCPF